MFIFTPPRLARDRRRPEGFIQPCQATLATKVPTGPQWLHELKYDGIRVIARKAGALREGPARLQPHAYTGGRAQRLSGRRRGHADRAAPQAERAAGGAAW